MTDRSQAIEMQVAEATPALGGKILSVIEQAPPIEAPMRGFWGDWGAYKIIVNTDRGSLVVSGCHDCGPDCEWFPLPKEDEG